MRRARHNRSSRTVLIADDHSLFRQGIRLLLEDDGRFTVVAESAGGDDVFRQIEIYKPELLLLDVQMPGLSGLRIADEVNQLYPDVKVILLTMHLDDERLYLALRARVHGFLTKDIKIDDLLTSLERVANGERIIQDVILQRPDFAKSVLARVRHGSSEASSVHGVIPRSLRVPLSDRETEVLGCVVQGLTNREIGEELYISEQTVKNHMSSVLRKLSVEHRLQAVVTALRHGWIRLDPPDALVAEDLVVDAV